MDSKRAGMRKMPVYSLSHQGGTSLLKAGPHWSKRLRFAAAFFILLISFCLIPNISAVGNDNHPKYILLRLEDIGPGGQYEGVEQLGKLRAVMELLEEHHVRYQLAVIPRWINIEKDGTRYDVSLDQQDNPYARAFVELLRKAEAGGALIGIHGYTHQVGDVRRIDGQHESGIGNEFDVSDVAETLTPAYAQARMEEALQIFAGTGLSPKFWEAPHYHTRPEQDAVFRCYFGLNYQSDTAKDRNANHPQYSAGRNTGYGEPSLGAVYVPTPFSYIPYNRDADIIVKQLDKSDKLPSFFFHPFLEFKYLTPVLDSQGEQVIVDGLPQYQYAGSGKSIMQRLLPQLEQKAYQFISLTDFVPFAPAKSVRLQATPESGVQLADVTGDGQPDVVQWDGEKGEIRVQRGRFTGVRNEPVGEASVWARIPLKPGEVWTMFDDNGDGRSDLWVMRLDGTMYAYRAGEGTFTLNRTWKVSTAAWADLYALNEGGAGWVLAGQSGDRMHLEAISLQGETFRPLAPLPLERKLSQLVKGDLDGNGKEELIVPFSRSSRWLQLSPNLTAWKWEKNAPALELPTGESGLAKVADYNGDGAQDVLFWNRAQQSFTVYLQTAPNKFQYLSQMGPWGPKKGKLIVTDLNGDGRADIAVVNGEEPYVDTAVSWESRNFVPMDQGS